ncbi:MAG: hypothetical protein Q9159_000889 [Coniocarpon cinnabarinum]
MAMRFRLRHPGGQATINLPESATIANLRQEIVKASDIQQYELKIGYPPQPLDLDAHDSGISISEAGYKLNGEQLIVARRQTDDHPEHPSAQKESMPAQSLTRASQPLTSPSTSPMVVDDTSVAEAIAREPLDTPEISLPARDGALVLRVMPDDNSCLFRALSYLMLGPSIDSMHELRSLVASTIASNPDMYSDAILGKPQEQYCRWIQTDASWGGYIELSILAKHFGTEVSSISVLDGRVDRFNEGAERRCILVYSGIHYDAVALSPNDRLGFGRKAEPEDDVKVFEGSDDIVLAAAMELCGKLREKHYYTDTSNFAIKCNICGWTGSGEKGATQHAVSTGHMDFGES